MKIVDVHTHAFPDKIANKTMETLKKINAPYKPFGDGTVKSLLDSMVEAKITSSFVLNIATKPEQSSSIINWAKEIKSEKIFPLGSIHPESSNWEKEIDAFKKEGIKGIKFQPMYQNFAIDEKRMLPIYEYIASSKMFVIFHSGEDIAFPGNKNSSVDKINKILNSIPKLTIIAAHFGGWRAWKEVLEKLCGKNIFIETSFINEVDERLRDEILFKHDKQRFLFGTDFPWGNQRLQVEFIKNLPKIDDHFKEGIFSKNIELLLNSL